MGYPFWDHGGHLGFFGGGEGEGAEGPQQGPKGPQPSAGARRRAAVGHPNLLVTIKTKNKAITGDLKPLRKKLMETSKESKRREPNNRETQKYIRRTGKQKA